MDPQQTEMQNQEQMQDQPQGDPMLDMELDNLLAQQNPQGMGYGSSWLTKDTQLNDKILSSHNKYKKLVKIRPKIEKMKVGLPLLDSHKNIVYKNILMNGEKVRVPILDKIRNINLVTGFELQEHDFPIPDWFNDSVTSSSLDFQESAFIRMVDEMAISLVLKTMNNSNVNYTGMLNELYFLKASVSDTAKAVGGRAMEMSKTSITKGDSLVKMYRREEFDKELESRKKSGLLGLGLFGIL
jgi:hypothetical protein